MRLMIASEVAEDKITEFLSKTDQVDQKSLLEDGYVVEIGDEIKGCFVLSTVENDIFWLKQLYIAKEAAQSLPVLLEMIIVLAKTKKAKKVYVHSHQPVVDILLGALQFHPQKEALNVNSTRPKQGNWWAYEVS
jgi:N-acetylglutamate synthase-like GNAT family acetyltransferase